MLLNSSPWRQRPARRCGLECGTSASKMVLVTRRRAAVCVDGVFVDEAPHSDRSRGISPSPLEMARHALINRDLAGYRTTFIPDGAVRSCFTLLPKMDRTDADGALLLQAQKTLAWDRSDPVMSHESSAFQRDRVGSVVALGDWKEMKLWCALVEGSGGVLEDITVRACAYEALARHQQWAQSSPVVLVADVGASSTCFYVLDRGRVRFMREVPVAGNAVTKALTAEISTDKGPIRFTDVEAEEFKTRGYLSSVPDIADPHPNTPPVAVPWSVSSASPAARAAASKNTDRLDMMMRPVIERIASEVTRSIQFFQENAGPKIDAVLLTGGSASLSLLKPQIESTVSLPVRLIDPFAGLAFRDAAVRAQAETARHRLAVAVGLALGEPLSISLLPRPIRAARQAADWAPVALVLLFLAAFLPLLTGIIVRSVEIQMLKPRIHAATKTLELAAEQSRRIADLQVKAQQQTETSRSLQALTVREPLWSGVLNTLSDSVPHDIVLTRVSTSLSSEGVSAIHLEGRVLPSAATFDDSVASFLSELSSSVFFGSVHVANATAAKADDRLGDFEIHCELMY